MPKAEHNKSPNARAAEGRGERTWTGWKLGLLIDQVLACNQRDVTATALRRVRNLEYLKVRLLMRSEPHHVRLRMPDPFTGEKVQYYALDTKKARKLTLEKVELWRSQAPTPDELDEMVEALTDHVFYRQRR